MNFLTISLFQQIHLVWQIFISYIFTRKTRFLKAKSKQSNLRVLLDLIWIILEIILLEHLEYILLIERCKFIFPFHICNVSKNLLIKNIFSQFFWGHEFDIKSFLIFYNDVSLTNFSASLGSVYLEKHSKHFILNTFQKLIKQIIFYLIN